MKLEWIEKTMGLFHLQMTILSEIFKIHYGKDSDQWSLMRWIPVLSQNINKLWNKYDSQVKDFNTCLDFFDTVLNGCLVGAISAYFFPTNNSTAQFEASLGTTSQSSLENAIQNLAKHLSDFDLVSRMRREPVEKRNFARENLLLFMQQGLMLRNLGLAMRQGDSGRMLNSLCYFTIWFQSTKNYKYASETLRLMASIKRLWSDEFRAFWMENCLINLSGKRWGFVALDMLNEYIVREVKSLIANIVTPATDEYLRKVLSPLIMIFWEIRRKMGEEAEVNIFDFHSSPVNSWREICKVANGILKTGLYQLCDDQGQQDGFIAQDLFADGVFAIAKTGLIEKLKKVLMNEKGYEGNEDAECKDGGCEDGEREDGECEDEMDEDEMDEGINESYGMIFSEDESEWEDIGSENE
jgi:hypothetical protein